MNRRASAGDIRLHPPLHSDTIPALVCQHQAFVRLCFLLYLCHLRHHLHHLRNLFHVTLKWYCHHFRHTIQMQVMKVVVPQVRSNVSLLLLLSLGLFSFGFHRLTLQHDQIVIMIIHMNWNEHDTNFFDSKC